MHVFNIRLKCCTATQCNSLMCDLGKHQARQEMLQARRGYEPEGVLGREGLHGVVNVVHRHGACRPCPHTLDHT